MDTLHNTNSRPAMANNNKANPNNNKQGGGAPRPAAAAAPPPRAAGKVGGGGGGGGGARLHTGGDNDGPPASSTSNNNKAGPNSNSNSNVDNDNGDNGDGGTSDNNRGGGGGNRGGGGGGRGSNQTNNRGGGRGRKNNDDDDDDNNNDDDDDDNRSNRNRGRNNNRRGKKRSRNDDDDDEDGRDNKTGMSKEEIEKAKQKEIRMVKTQQRAEAIEMELKAIAGMAAPEGTDTNTLWVRDCDPSLFTLEKISKKPNAKYQTYFVNVLYNGARCPDLQYRAPFRSTPFVNSNDGVKVCGVLDDVEVSHKLIAIERQLQSEWEKNKGDYDDCANTCQWTPYVQLQKVSDPEKQKISPFKDPYDPRIPLDEPRMGDAEFAVNYEHGKTKVYGIQKNKTDPKQLINVMKDISSGNDILWRVTAPSICYQPGIKLRKVYLIRKAIIIQKETDIKRNYTRGRYANASFADESESERLARERRERLLAGDGGDQDQQGDGADAQNGDSNKDVNGNGDGGGGGGGDDQGQGQADADGGGGGDNDNGQQQAQKSVSNIAPPPAAKRAKASA